MTVEPIEATGISINKEEIVFNGEQSLILDASIEPSGRLRRNWSFGK